MITVVLEHDVQDFDTWKGFFDQHQATRAAAGVKHHIVGRKAGAPNTAVVITEWESVEAFQAFVQSPDLQEVMKAGGVTSAPTVTVIERSEHGHYA